MGAGAIHVPDFYQAPRVGLYKKDSALFDMLTQRMDIKCNQVAIPTGVVGQTVNFKLPARGIISDLRLHFDLSIVVASYSSLTALDKWPYNLIRQISVRANNTDLVKCSGLDLEILRRMRYQQSDFSDIEATTVSGSNGTKDIDFVVDIPLCTDPTTRTGAVFAQTDDTHIEVDITFESEAQLFTLSGGTTFTWSGVINPTVTAWEVPTIVAPNGARSLVLPNLDVHAMVGSRNTFTTSSGIHKIEFSRTYGQLLRYAWTVWDDSAKAYLDPLTAAASDIKFQYGQNQTLRRHSPRDLMHLNAQWYRDVLGKGYLSIDFAAENSYRDVVVPAEVMDMELELDMSAASLANNDYVHSLEQVVIKSETFAEARPVAMQAAA